MFTSKKLTMCADLLDELEQSRLRNQHLRSNIREIGSSNMLQLYLNNIRKSHDNSSIDSINDRSTPSKQIISAVMRDRLKVILRKTIFIILIPFTNISLLHGLRARVIFSSASREIILNFVAGLTGSASLRDSAHAACNA